jgi:hypothetical protein
MSRISLTFFICILIFTQAFGQQNDSLAVNKKAINQFHCYLGYSIHRNPDWPE